LMIQAGRSSLDKLKTEFLSPFHCKNCHPPEDFTIHLK
jgi:hypothetical protein